MAPSKAAVAPYSKDERVLCFHHEMLYEAKILDSRPTEDGQSWQYKIHYKGWKNTWDDWVPQDRVRKFTEENKELAAQLQAQMKALQQKQASSAKAAKKGRANGSDFSSARGSEERHMSTAAQSGRGPRKNRDYDLENTNLKLCERGGTVGTMAKRRRTSSPESDNSSSLSVLSRTPSPIPPDLTSSPTLLSTASPSASSAASPQLLSPENDLGSSASPKKRRKISHSSPAKPSRRSTRAVAAHPRRDSRGAEYINILRAEAYLPRDNLTLRPPKNYTYITASGGLRDGHKYTDWITPEGKPHPRLLQHIEKGTASWQLKHYYWDMPHDRCLPIAGIINEISLEPLFRGNVLIKDFNFQEDNFLSRPSIKLVMPDHLKAILVDDWENVTKNQQLAPVPSAHPVNDILADYLAFEKPKREPGSPQADILEEAVAGLKTYFDKCLGRILLYRFERPQYLEILEATQKSSGDLSGKSMGDIYGAEHFCRLLVSLPELIAQTNMDQQSVNRLREELSKVTMFLGKHATEYFANEYETPNQAYIEQARGF